jgi:hypothetical protein
LNSEPKLLLIRDSFRFLPLAFSAISRSATVKLEQLARGSTDQEYLGIRILLDK